MNFSSVLLVRFFSRRNLPNFTIISLVASLLLLVILSSHLPQYDSHQHYIALARSFTQGSFDLESGGWKGPWLDTTLINERHYWPTGALPALILIPLVFLSDKLQIAITQWPLNFAITVGVLLLAFKLARKYRFNSTDAVWLATAFVFASVYHLIAFVPWSWYLAQGLATLTMLAALNEYYGKRRWWFMGVMVALTLASRPLAGLSVLFFAGAILIDHKTLYERGRALAMLVLPILIMVLLLAGYNMARFGSPLEFGYSKVHTYWDAGAQYEREHYGLLQFGNIPTNLYYYFLKIPDPNIISVPGITKSLHILTPPYLKINNPGVSFFVVSPLFLYLFWTRWNSRTVRLALLPVVPILLYLMMFYTSGWVQIGPRYLIDLLPFTYLLLLEAFPSYTLSTATKYLIVASSLVNVFLLFLLLR